MRMTLIKRKYIGRKGAVKMSWNTSIFLRTWQIYYVKCIRFQHQRHLKTFCNIIIVSLSKLITVFCVKFAQWKKIAYSEINIATELGELKKITI